MIGHWCMHNHPDLLLTLQQRISSEGQQAGQWAATQWQEDKEHQRRMLRIDSSVAFSVTSWDVRVETAFYHFAVEDTFIAPCCQQWTRAWFLMAAEEYRPWKR